MSYTITIANSGDHIVIEVHGTIDRHIGTQWTAQAHSLGLKLGIHSYLVDVTDAVNTDSTIGQYNFANVDIPELETFDRFAKVAILANPEDHTHDFIETVCRNSGFNFRLFRTRDDALAFLGVTAG